MTRNRNQNAIGLNLYHAFISHDGSQGWENAWSDVVRFVRTISVEIMTRHPLPRQRLFVARRRRSCYGVLRRERIQECR